MPFLVPTIENKKKTTFYIVRGIAPHLGVSFVVKEMAKSFFQQNKKVLVFDTLLGLKNIPLSNKNQKKITLVCDGTLPLNELIIHEQGIDYITGVSDQNLTALSALQQQFIKANLKQLANNYDIVLIDLPCQVISPIWADMGENLWIVSTNKEMIYKTLATAPQQNPHLIFNKRENTAQLNQIYAFAKILRPSCQITFF